MDKPSMRDLAAMAPQKMGRVNPGKAAARGPAQERPRGITPHGIRVLDFMRQNKVRGNYRDYVLFVADRMWDAWAEYKLPRPAAADNPEGAPLVALVHKRDLHKVIGPLEAKRFWDSKLKRRTSFKG